MRIPTKKLKKTLGIPPKKLFKPHPGVAVCVNILYPINPIAEIVKIVIMNFTFFEKRSKKAKLTFTNISKNKDHAGSLRGKMADGIRSDPICT